MKLGTAAIIVLLLLPLVSATGNDPRYSPTLWASPPQDEHTTVLFGGLDFKRWHLRDGSACNWQVQPDGSVKVSGGDAVTAASFGDFQLHLEFRCPEMPDKAGQARANSGVYLHGRYEVQVLDTFGQEPFMGGCGAVYGIAPPLVNASRPAGAWQTYDMIFRSPRFAEDGSVSENPRLTVLHNGIVIHNNLELPKTTAGGIDGDMVATGPLLLQDHGDPLRYRNIWIRELDG